MTGNAQSDAPAGDATKFAGRHLDDQLCFALYAATNALTRLYRPLLAELGLTYPQYLVMLVLWEEKRCTSGHVARRLNLAPNAVTPLIDRLIAAGFVTRTPAEGDRRRYDLDLTRPGAALEDRVGAVQDAVACRTAMGPAEIDDLCRRLHALARAAARSPAA